MKINSFLEFEKDFINFKKEYEELKKVLEAVRGTIKAGELAVITKGYNQDKIFFCTHIARGQVEGIFPDGKVYIGELKNCRKLVNDNPALEQRFKALKDFLERSVYEETKKDDFRGSHQNLVR